MRFIKLSVLPLALLALYGQMVCAQQTVQADYPTKPIRVVVPYAAGGPMDYIGRTLGRKMQHITTLVIDNRPGAGGALGADLVAKAAPDGYTMLHTSSSHASLPVITKALPYDSINDFTPITLIVNSVGFLLVAHNGITARTLPEFIASVKSQPGKITYGSGGVGNVMHFAAELFNDRAGTQLMHIPYKGVGQAIVDLAAGRVDTCFGPATALLPQIKAGRIKALGITATNRWSGLPDVPTIDEAGVKGYVFVPWYGLWFPARTPDAYVKRMRNEVVTALQDPDIRAGMGEQGFAPAGSTPAEFAKIIADEIQTNRRLAAKINLQPE
jgi:tripartite-type tricarboxylate transporter receptor subunit TctC